MRRIRQFLSVFFLPLLTLLLASGYSLTGTNLSVIGNTSRFIPFLLWGALTGISFYLFTDRLFEMTACQDFLARAFLTLSLYLFMAAVGLPYLPGILPVLSRLHVQISFLAPLFLCLSQVRFLIFLEKTYGFRFPSLWIFQFVLALGSALIFLGLGMVTSLLELYVILGASVYLRLLARALEKEGRETDFSMFL